MSVLHSDQCKAGVANLYAMRAKFAEVKNVCVSRFWKLHIFISSHRAHKSNQSKHFY